MYIKVISFTHLVEKGEDGGNIMKFKKIISKLIIASMVISQISAMVPAVNAEQSAVLYEMDFTKGENCSEGWELKNDISFNEFGMSITPKNSYTVCKATYSIKSENKPIKDILHISASVKAEKSISNSAYFRFEALAEDCENPTVLEFKLSKDLQEGDIYVNGKIDDSYSTENNQAIGKFNAEKWCDVDLYYDVPNAKWYVGIGQDGEKITTNSEPIIRGELADNGIDLIRFESKALTTKISNMKAETVSTIPEGFLPPDEEEIYKMGVGEEYNLSGESELKKSYYLPDVIKEGKIIIDFDLEHNSKGVFYCDLLPENEQKGQGSAAPYINLSSGKTIIGHHDEATEADTTGIGAAFAGGFKSSVTKQHITLTIMPERGVYDISFSDAKTPDTPYFSQQNQTLYAKVSTGTTTKPTFKYVQAFSLKSINFRANAEKAVVSGLVITRIKPSPELLDSSVTITDSKGNTVKANNARVNKDIENITLDFGRKMPNPTDDEGITLLCGSTEIAYTINADESKKSLWIIKPNEELLPETEYTIFVPKGICDASGAKMKAEYEATFVTKKYIPANVIMDITENEEWTEAYNAENGWSNLASMSLPKGDDYSILDLSDGTERTIGYTLPETITEGKVNIDFDLELSSSGDLFYFELFPENEERNHGTAAPYVKGTTTILGHHDEASEADISGMGGVYQTTVKRGVVQHISVTVMPERGLYDISISSGGSKYFEATGQKLYAKVKTGLTTNPKYRYEQAFSLKCINFRAKAETAKVDNLVISTESVMPELSDSYVTITDADGNTFDGTEKYLSSVIDKIALDFGTQMPEPNGNEGIKLFCDGKEVECSIVLDNTKSNIWNIVPKAILDELAYCELIVPAGIKDKKNIELYDTYNLTFMTLKEEESYKVKGITEPDEQTVVIDTKAVNTSANTKELLYLVAYYDCNGRCLLIETKNESISAKNWLRTEPTIYVQKPQSAVATSVMLWDNDLDINPYCDSYEVGNMPEEKALEVEGVVTNLYDGYITITGNAQGSVVTELTKNNSIVDARQKNTEGQYTVKIPVTDFEEGEYELRIRDSKLTVKTIYLSTMDSLKEKYLTLMQKDTLSDFTNYINDNACALNFASEVTKKQLTEAELSDYYEYIKTNPLTLDSADDEVKNRSVFTKYVLAKKLNNNSIQNVSAVMEEMKLCGDEFVILFDNVADSEEAQRFFTAKMSGKAISNADEFDLAAKQALILTACKYAGGFEEIKQVIQKYDVAATNDSAYRELVGKNFETYDAFKKAYNPNPIPDKQGNGNGGTTGGGISTSGKDISVVVSGSSNAGTVGNVQVRRTFIDLDSVVWAAEAILALADKNIVNGVDDERFLPDNNVTREAFTKILIGAMKLSNSSSYSNTFNDVKESDWFAADVNIAFNQGIISGVGQNEFGVGRSILRQDMAVMLCNALKIRGVTMDTSRPEFDDFDEISDYAKDAVSALYNLGAINGMTETTFVPMGTATRAQAAKIIYSVLDKLG